MIRHGVALFRFEVVLLMIFWLSCVCCLESNSMLRYSCMHSSTGNSELCFRLFLGVSGGEHSCVLLLGFVRVMLG